MAKYCLKHYMSMEKNMLVYCTYMCIQICSDDQSLIFYARHDFLAANTSAESIFYYIVNIIFTVVVRTNEQLFQIL